MSAVLTRAIALPLVTLVFAVACSDGVTPTQPLRTPAEASAAKQGTTGSRMLFYVVDVDGGDDRRARVVGERRRDQRAGDLGGEAATPAVRPEDEAELDLVRLAAEERRVPDQPAALALDHPGGQRAPVGAGQDGGEHAAGLLRTQGAADVRHHHRIGEERDELIAVCLPVGPQVEPRGPEQLDLHGAILWHVHPV